MKYSVITMEDKGDFFYCVFENLTQQSIDFFFFKDDALKCAEFYERGGGFDGFTPSFILKEIIKTANINEEFTSKCAIDKTNSV